MNVRGDFLGPPHSTITRALTCKVKKRSNDQELIHSDPRVFFFFLYLISPTNLENRFEVSFNDFEIWRNFLLDFLTSQNAKIEFYITK